MRIEQVIKEYTPFLLKTTYLIVRDRAKVEAIVEQTYFKFKAENNEFIKPSVIKSKLIECLVKSLSEYYKSWSYQKLFVKRMFDNGEQYVHPGYQDDLSYAILRLPLKLREIATFYFYAERTSAEISRLLGVAQGTVQQRLLKAIKLMDKPIFEEEVGKQTAPIDAYLTEWDERAEFLEQKLIDVVEEIEVSPAIKKKRKKRMISLAAIVGVILVFGISAFILKKDSNSRENQQQIGKLEQTYSQNVLEIFPGASRKGDALVPSDIALEIAKYHEYYLGTGMYSLTSSELGGSSELYRYFITLYILEKNNYPFNMERIESYQERANIVHKENMENPYYKKFVQILSSEHNITEQEIIDYYLVPKEVVMFLEEQYLNTVDESNTNLYEYDYWNEYYKIIGLDMEKQYIDFELKQQEMVSKYEPLTDLSKLPFSVEEDSYLQFALDEEGQIITLNPGIQHFSMGMSDFYDLIFGFKDDVNRLSLQDFIVYLQERYEETKEASLLGFIEYCKIVLRSIDLETK